jgi:phosphoserine phosphatase
MRGLARVPPEVLAVLRRVWSRAGPRQVVFDADGTLWRGDIGEDFLRYVAHERLLVGAARGVYAEYERRLATDALGAYAFAVEVMAGLNEARLREICRDFFSRRFAGRVFPWVRPVLERLRRTQVEVWVCSASPKWIVEAGAEALGLSAAQVIGVESEIVAGQLTSAVVPPVTAGPGKVVWLERRQVRAALAVGNGALDVDMLAWAETALVVAPYDAPDTALAREGLSRGWPVLRC